MIIHSFHRDPQQQPSRPCPRCRRETYGPTYHCIYCEKHSPVGADAHIAPVHGRGLL